MPTAEPGLNNMPMLTACFILDSLHCFFFELSVVLGLLCFYDCLSSRAVVAKLELWLGCFFSHFLLLESLVDLRSLSDLISNTK